MGNSLINSNKIKIKAKGLQDFLCEDSSLSESISYEEYLEKKAAPGNSDDELVSVYRTYRSVIDKL